MADDTEIKISLTADDKASPQIKKLLSEIKNLQKQAKASFAKTRIDADKIIDPSVAKQLKAVGVEMKGAAQNQLSYYRRLAKDNKLTRDGYRRLKDELTGLSKAFEKADAKEKKRIGAAMVRNRQHAVAYATAWNEAFDRKAKLEQAAARRTLDLEALVQRRRAAEHKATNRILEKAQKAEEADIRRRDRERYKNFRFLGRLQRAEQFRSEKERRDNFNKEMRDNKFRFDLRRRHDEEQRRAARSNRQQMMRAGRRAIGAPGQMLNRLDSPFFSSPFFYATMGAGAAAAGTRSIVRDAVGLDRAETYARMHMTQSEVKASDLRKWATGQGPNLGIGADALLSTAVEAAKAGVPDKMAADTAIMMTQLSKVFNLDPEQTIDHMGYAIAQEMGAGRLTDMNSVRRLGNTTAYLAGKTSANPLQMLSFLRSGLGSGAGIGMSQQATMAFGAAAVQAGAQGQQASRALGSIVSDVSGLEARAKEIRRRGATTTKDRMFLRLPGKLGYGGYTDIANQLREDPDNAIFELIKSFANIEDPLERDQAYKTIFGEEFGRFIKNMIASPGMLDRTRELAREAFEQNADNDFIVKAWKEYTNGLEFMLDQIGSTWKVLKEDLGDGLKPFISDLRDWVIGWHNQVGSGGLKAMFSGVISGLVRGFGFDSVKQMMVESFGTPGGFDMTNAIKAFEFGSGFAKGIKDVASAVGAVFTGLGALAGIDTSTARGVGELIGKIIALSFALHFLRPVISVLGMLGIGLRGLASAAVFLNRALIGAGFMANVGRGAGFAGLGASVLARFGVSLGAGMLPMLAAGLLGGGITLAGVALVGTALAVAIMNWDKITKAFDWVKEKLGFGPSKTARERAEEVRDSMERNEKERSKYGPDGPKEIWEGLKKLWEWIGPSKANASEMPIRQLGENFNRVGAQIQLASLGAAASAIPGAGLSTNSFTPAIAPLVPTPGAGGSGGVNAFGLTRNGIIGGQGSGGGQVGGPNVSSNYPNELGAAIKQSAKDLGISAEDLATMISFETAGTFDPWKKGPTTKWGQHRGLIQWGEPQRKKYGVYEGMPVGEQMQAVTRYLKDRGVRPGMNGMNVYAAINAGHASKVNASDAAAGGTWGTVADKWNYQMGGHRKKAAGLLASSPDPSSSTASLPTPMGWAPETPQSITQGVPSRSMNPMSGAGIAGGAMSSPNVNIHINGNNSDPEALAALVQKRINESLNWRTHDVDHDV